MELPKNKSELETILGMINYLSRFAPRLAEINALLRQMLKQGNEFTWDETHNAAFQQIKDLITREPGPVLAYYNPNKALWLQVDASKNGLGTVLLQKEKPIEYASKSDLLVLEYWNHRDEISFADGILLKEKIVSDNGPQYSSQEFSTLC